MRRETKRLNDIRFSFFIGRFQSDGVASMTASERAKTPQLFRLGDYCLLACLFVCGPQLQP